MAIAISVLSVRSVDDKRNKEGKECINKRSYLIFWANVSKVSLAAELSAKAFSSMVAREIQDRAVD